MRRFPGEVSPPAVLKVNPCALDWRPRPGLKARTVSRGAERRPRMDKQEREFRLRGTGNRVKEGGGMMRFAGIDIGAERHVVAVLDEQGEVLCRSSPFGEDATGYHGCSSCWALC